jgi:putative DNA primase/helicase
VTAPLDSAFAPLAPEEIVATVGDDCCDGEIVMPIPADAPEMPSTHPGLGRPSARWIYRHGTGATVFEVWRFDPLSERKQFVPLLWRGATGLRWRWKGIPKASTLWA